MESVPITGCPDACVKRVKVKKHLSLEENTKKIEEDIVASLN